MKKLLICALLLSNFFVFGQDSKPKTKNDIFLEIQDPKTPNDGKILIFQDENIQNLTNRYIDICESENKMDGWRIQIYNSSGKEARNEANSEREKFINKYPEIKAYLVYQAPYFKIRVGNFRTKQDAFEVYKQIVKDYPISYLVPDNIKFPEL